MLKVLRFIHKIVLVILILLGSVSIKPYPASAQVPGGVATLIPLNKELLQDPGFEASLQPGSPWVQHSQNFGTPLFGCNGGFCNANTGSVWAWFGGTSLDEEGWVYQDVTIPQCGATLYFYLSISATPGADQDDLFRVVVDSSTVFEANATNANSYSNYTWVPLDISQFADGGVHRVMFYSSTSGQPISFNLDDISLMTGGSSSLGCEGINVMFKGGTFYEYVIPFGTAADRVSYTGVNTGSLQIWSLAGEQFIASERVAYSPDGGTTWTSFSEMMGLAYKQLGKRYYFPWYNNKNLNTQLRVGSLEADFDTTVTITIGGILRGTYNLPPDTTLRLSYPNLDSGPVVIESSIENIIASERVAYLNPQNNKWTSFSEIMGIPSTQVSTSYWFPLYNNVDLNQQLRFGNIGGSTTTVCVWIGGVSKGCYPLSPGGSKRVAYPVAGGPVLIQSSGGVSIVASLRVGYTPDNGATWPDVSEMMGLPGSAVSTSYYFPWYNNIDLNTQLRFANIGNTTTTVTVWLGGVLKGTYVLPPNASKRVAYPVNSGPVMIKSLGGVPIVASERVAYSPNGGITWTSYSEMMGLPANELNQLPTHYVFPWYNNVDLNTQLRFGVP